MSVGHSKNLSLTVWAICFCLSFSSLASAYVMTPHNMVSSDTSTSIDDSFEENARHSHDSVDNHHSNIKSNPTDDDHHSHDHATSHKCCDGDNDACARADSVCATHCSVSVAQSVQYIHPMIVIAGFADETELANPLPVCLEGPFKPPR